MLISEMGSDFVLKETTFFKRKQGYFFGFYKKR